MHDHERGPSGSSGTNGSPCLHCIINQAMDTYGEAQHRMTGQKVNIDDNIDDLIACIATGSPAPIAPSMIATTSQGSNGAAVAAEGRLKIVSGG